MKEQKYRVFEQGSINKGKFLPLLTEVSAVTARDAALRGAELYSEVFVNGSKIGVQRSDLLMNRTFQVFTVTRPGVTVEPAEL